MSSLAYQYEPKYEKHGGKIVSMAPCPNLDHGRVVNNISRIFSNYLLDKTCEVWGDDAYVHLTEEDTFIPDITVVCNPGIIKKAAIHGAPDLVAEILSPSTGKSDRTYKKSVYEKCGVKEYWIITIETRSIEVYLLKDGKYELDNIYSVYPDYLLEQLAKENREKPVTEFSPSMFPDLVISLEDVFRKLT